VAGTTAEEVRKAIGAGTPSASRKIVRYALPLLGALALVLVGARVVRSRAAATGPTYETAKATRADVRVTVTATGTLEAITTVEVGAEVTGRLLTVLVDANDAVKKGQLLAEIDPEQLRASADEARAQVASADAAIRQAEATRVESQKAAARARQQAKQGLVADKDLESAEAAAERAEAALQSAVAAATVARATLTSARSKLDKTKIIAPIDGLVLSRHVEPGQTVTAGFSTPLLFKLAQDLTQMRLNVDVDEADMGRIREGQEASFTVEAYPERAFSSRVTSLRNEPKTSQNVVTYQGVLSVDNTERLLRPGMTCTATILSDTRKDVLVVPNAALRYAPPILGGPGGGPHKEVGATRDAGKKQRVWVLKAGKPEPIPVRAGATDGAVTEIVSGDVTPGTEVVTDMREAN
jgi:HlyD family secretion protein